MNAVAALKRYLNARPDQKRVFKRAAHMINALSPWRFQMLEAGLIWGLQKRIAWKLRQDWQFAEHPPHFFPHRYGCFGLAFDRADLGSIVYSRAFLSAEMVRPGDTVLDIGVATAPLSARFLAPHASLVDAIDVEPTAIAHAMLVIAIRVFPFVLLMP